MNNVAATVQPSRCWIKTARPSRRATAEATQGNEHDEISSQHSSQQPNVASKPEMEESSGDSADSRQLALALARACWETKGEDLMVLHVAPLVYWTQYLIIVTVFSKPQLGAMLAKVEKVAQEAFGRQPAQPAQGRSSWELLDFGDVVVNVLTADQREYYDLVCLAFFFLLGGLKSEKHRLINTQ